MSGFQTKYDQWIRKHEQLRQGERLRRLTEGHSHAEKWFLEQVWFPVFRHFEHLHPEYETADYQEGVRYLDFAYLRLPLKLAIEIDGYGPHHAKMSRWQFSDQCMRQNHLIIDGWKVLRFSYDDVKERPRICQQLLQQFMGSYFGGGSLNEEFRSSSTILTLVEREVLRLGMRLGRNLRPGDVMELLQVNKDKARRILRSMLDQDLLLKAGEGVKRVRCYKVNQERPDERKLSHL